MDFKKDVKVLKTNGLTNLIRMKLKNEVEKNNQKIWSNRKHKDI